MYYMQILTETLLMKPSWHSSSEGFQEQPLTFKGGAGSSLGSFFGICKFFSFSVGMKYTKIWLRIDR
jgi:hypothetical protein